MALLGPLNVVHPNLAPPLACIGHIPPGFSLVDLLYQVYEILTYEKWAAHDFLNAEAAVWARQNHQIFPLDRRPLKRRPLPVTDTPRASGGTE